MVMEYQGQKAVLYARVSTDDKDQRPENQIEVMEDYCKREGIIIVGRYIEEKSGKDIDRPVFLEVMARIAKGSFTWTYGDKDSTDPATCKVDLLLAWNISRISREQRDYMNIQHELEKYGCRIRFVQESTKPETMEGRLIATIGAWQAEQERKKISENTRMGMRQRKINGQHVSKPFRVVFKEDIDKGMYPLKGMIRTDDGAKHKTVITTELDVYGWASEGLSAGKIAREKLHVPYTTFYDLLKNTGRLDAFKQAQPYSIRGGYDKGSETAPEQSDKGGSA